MQILIAEENLAEGERVRRALLEAGYSADLVRDGEDTVALAAKRSYAALILGARRSRSNYLGVIQDLRDQAIDTPIILLTAPDKIEDGVQGLDAGADDYLVKPFSLIELLARLRAALRRYRPEKRDRLRVEDLEMDRKGRTVTRRRRHLELTNREFALLEVLMLASPEPVSKTGIIERVWRGGRVSNTNVVNVFVNHLRNKISLPGAPPLLHTVRGVGFVLRNEMS
jgi:DNA-binding response OmpR family regulator